MMRIRLLGFVFLCSTILFGRGIGPSQKVEQATQTDPEVVEGVLVATAPPEEPDEIPQAEMQTTRDRIADLIEGVVDWVHSQIDHFRRQTRRDRAVMSWIAFMVLHQGFLGKPLHFRF